MHKARQLNVAVVGATGLVGQSMLGILQERQFTDGRIVPVASARSRGKQVAVGDRQVTVEVLDEFDFADIDIALFSPGSSVSREHAPRAAAAGCIVIDNTSCFRYDDDIPLIVPEVNAADIRGYQARNIIANPNCSTIQMVVALKPIHDYVGVDRINIATYQAVSGAGQALLDRLAHETRAILQDETPPDTPFAYNAVPAIDTLQDNGYTREEMKMVWETRKIMGDASIRVNATAVRVPVTYGHSEAIHLETRAPFDMDELLERLDAAPGVSLIRDAAAFPTARTHADGNDPVYVGRVRRDITHEQGLNLWVVADNVRKGAALNSVQIAEVLADYHL